MAGGDASLASRLRADCARSRTLSETGRQCGSMEPKGQARTQYVWDDGTATTVLD